jgi:hypothetical protein
MVDDGAGDVDTAITSQLRSPIQVHILAVHEEILIEPSKGPPHTASVGHRAATATEDPLLLVILTMVFLPHTAVPRYAIGAVGVASWVDDRGPVVQQHFRGDGSCLEVTLEPVYQGGNPSVVSNCIVVQEGQDLPLSHLGPSIHPSSQASVPRKLEQANLGELALD